MKLLFLQDNGLNESLLVAELSACLLALGHSTSLLLENEENDLKSSIEKENPDIIFLPVSVLAHYRSIETIGWLKRRFPSVPVVIAGSHPTF